MSHEPPASVDESNNEFTLYSASTVPYFLP